jgi:hypothetical protein
MKTDYQEIYDNFKLNNQYWTAELVSGEILQCGFGLVENEFTGDTFEEIGKVIEDELQSIDGYYTFDGAHQLLDKNGKGCGVLSDIGYQEHPDEDSFYLVPKSDIVKTSYTIRNKTSPKVIKTK